MQSRLFLHWKKNEFVFCWRRWSDGWHCLLRSFTDLFGSIVPLPVVTHEVEYTGQWRKYLPGWSTCGRLHHLSSTLSRAFFGNTKVCSKCMELKMIHNAGYSFLGKLSLKLCCWGLAKLSLRFSIGGGAAPWKANLETTIYILNVHATSCGCLVSWNI